VGRAFWSVELFASLVKQQTSVKLICYLRWAGGCESEERTQPSISKERMNLNPSVNPRPFSAAPVTISARSQPSARTPASGARAQRPRTATMTTSSTSGGQKWPQRHMHNSEIVHTATDQPPRTAVFAPTYHKKRPVTAPLRPKMVQKKGAATTTGDVSMEVDTLPVVTSPGAAEQQVEIGKGVSTSSKSTSGAMIGGGSSAVQHRPGTPPLTPPGMAPSPTSEQNKHADLSGKGGVGHYKSRTSTGMMNSGHPAVVVEEPHLQSRAAPPHSKYNKEFMKEYYKDDPRFANFDENANKNTYHNPVTTTMIDLQLNNPEVRTQMETPRPVHRPNITSLHQMYNLGKASYGPPVPIYENQYPKLEGYDNLDGTFQPRELMRPKSAGNLFMTKSKDDKKSVYLDEWGTNPANKRRDARVPVLQEDRAELNRDYGSGGYGMDTTAKNGFPISRQPVVTESARGRTRSADPALSSRSVATYSEYPAEQSPERPPYADWDVRQLSTLSPKKQEIYKEYWRQKARIPTTNNFPYRYCLGWDAARPRRPPMFAYNPITHQTDVFVTDQKSGLITMQKTDFQGQELPPSVESGQGFNRRKGIGEYSDLTHITNPRWNRAYQKEINQNE
ncbi:unnamed protein product, partial [Amoebophrya sp. A120]